MLKRLLIIVAVVHVVAVVWLVATFTFIGVYQTFASDAYIVDSLTVTGTHYDIHYDGATCFQWVDASRPSVVLNPIVAYDYPIGGFNILTCREDVE